MGLRRRLEHAERASEDATRRARQAAVEVRRLQRVLDQMPQGVVVCDESGRVVFRNRHAVASADARHADALVARAVDELLAVSASGERQARSLELHGPPARTLELTGSAVHEEGRLIGTVAIIDDVTERRHLDAVRRDFVANVSHELRTPVGAVGVLADTLAGEEDPGVVRRLTARLVSEVERLGRMIEDLLDLGRIEAEETLVREPVKLAAVLEAAVERVLPVADAHHVHLRTAGEVAGVVAGNERQLVSALANLLDNAVKHSESGGTVVVSAREASPWAELVVRDDGTGIPASDIERIFERFYRVDRARSRQTGGTGLGLAIVRHVTSNHGGQVLVESREGEGSTFTMRLPLSDRWSSTDAAGS